MKIVVTTPNGHVGSRVVQLLLQAGVRPTLLARHPARIDPRVRERADVVQADQADADAVVRATRGAGEIDGLARAEELLDATGSSVLHLRCGFFFTNLDVDSLRSGVVRVAAPIGYPQPWVDPRDIGDVAAARLLSGGWSGRHVQAVHGPEDLTLVQVADILTGALGRPIRAETISEDAQRSSLRSAGFGDRQIEGMVGMSAVMRHDFAPEDKRTLITTTPTTLAAWAHAHLRPALGRV